MRRLAFLTLIAIGLAACGGGGAVFNPTATAASTPSASDPELTGEPIPDIDPELTTSTTEAPSPTTVRLDLQEVRDEVASLLAHSFSDYRFMQDGLVRIGDIGALDRRIAEGDIEAWVDPQVLGGTSNAKYFPAPCVGPGCATYFNDIVFEAWPTGSTSTVWHEFMHAIYHQVGYDNLLIPDDEAYTTYFDSALLGLEALTGFEEAIEEQFASDQCDQNVLDGRWERFVTAMADARAFGGAQAGIASLSEAHLGEIRRLTGFEVDVEKIRSGYIARDLFYCPNWYAGSFLGSFAIPTPDEVAALGTTLPEVDFTVIIDPDGTTTTEIAFSHELPMEGGGTVEYTWTGFCDGTTDTDGVLACRGSIEVTVVMHVPDGSSPPFVFPFDLTATGTVTRPGITGQAVVDGQTAAFEAERTSFVEVP